MRSREQLKWADRCLVGAGTVLVAGVAVERVFDPPLDWGLIGLGVAAVLGAAGSIAYMNEPAASIEQVTAQQDQAQY